MLTENGAKVLKPKKYILKIAFYEKARFYAKRIALNESARAYNTAKATEFLNDENVQFVKYKMSHTHPRADICDYFANADLYTW